MRSGDAWLAFRDRWLPSADSTGVAIREVADTVLPVVVVGYDERDNKSTNYGAGVVTPAAFGHLHFSPPVPVWLLSLWAESTQPVFVELIAGSIVAPQNIFLRPLFSALLFSDPVAIPFGTTLPGVPVDFGRPGFLIRPGEVLHVGSRNLATDLTVRLVVAVA